MPVEPITITISIPAAVLFLIVALAWSKGRH